MPTLLPQRKPTTALALLALAVLALCEGALGSASSPRDFAEDLGANLMGVVVPRAAAAVNLQTFQGALGGQAAPAITQSTDPTRPFEVDGDTFTDFQSAANRACDNQHNSCADAANAKKSSSLTVGDCDQQNTQCKAAASSATQTAFTALTSSNAEFDFFCDL